MKRLLKNRKNFILKCGKRALYGELLFKIISVAVIYPLILFETRFLMKITGTNYITGETIKGFLKSPSVHAGVVLLLLLFGIYTIYEINLFLLFYETKDNKDVTYYEIFNEAFKRSVRFLKPDGIPVLISVIVLMIMLSLTNLVMNYMINNSYEYIVNIIHKQIHISVYVYYSLMVIGFFLMYAPIFMIIYDISFGKSFLMSIKKVTRNIFKYAFFYAYEVFMIIVKALILYTVFSILIVIGVFVLNRTDVGIALYLSAMQVGYKLIMVLLFIMANPYTLSMIFNNIYDELPTDVPTIEKANKRDDIILRIFAGACLILTAFYVFSAVKKNNFSSLGVTNPPMITAHRGSMAYAPENTISAFERAISDYADYVELDVKETKDGVIVVLHDANLKRTTGVNKNIWEVDYEYVQTLDAGSWFSEDFADERIPTLKEVIELCKGKVKMNIEIKPTGHDKNLERGVADLIKEYNLYDSCVVTSMKYSVLTKIKKLNPRIKTGYTMTAAYGRFYEMQYADAFSIKHSFVTKNLVDMAHAHGKEVYVWTVNGDKDMEELTKMNVDNIITNNPVKCRVKVYEKYSNEHILDILKYVFH